MLELQPRGRAIHRAVAMSRKARPHSAGPVAASPGRPWLALDRWPGRRSIVTGACAALLVATAAASEPIKPSPLVEALLADPALPEASRRQMALFHGLWEQVSEPTVAERARIALQQFRLLDPALDDEEAEVLVRAEAAVARGQAELALELTSVDPSAQGALLRAQALQMLGRTDEAVGALIPLRQRLGRDCFEDAAELTAAARALAMLAQMQGRPARDFHQAMGFLAVARDQLDRFYWAAHLAEAELLAAKGNGSQAREALGAVLQLNRRCGLAWLLLGQLALRQFDFDRAGECHERLVAIYPEHLLAQILLAQILLTQGDPAAALQVLAPACRQYPQQRELLALRAAAEALRFNDTGCRTALLELDGLWPNSPLGYYTAGRYLAAARQYRLAAPMLHEAIGRQGNWPDPRIELGLMLLQAGDERGAHRQLQMAVELDRFHARALNSLKLTEQLVSYQQICTPHFVISFRKGIDRVLAVDIAAQIETIYDDVTQWYGHRPGRTTSIQIMPDAKWFAVRITGMPWIWTIGACTGDVIALTPPRQGANQRGSFDWFDVVRHEFVHTVTLDRTDNRIPHWFTEACAVASQRTRRDFATCRLLAAALAADRLLDLDQINWAFIQPKTPDARTLAYAQADWMLQFITTQFGHEAVLGMLEAYRAGGGDRKVLEQVAGMDVARFMQQFKQWAADQVVQWGLGPQASDRLVANAVAGQVADQVLEDLLLQHPNHTELLKRHARRALEQADEAAARQAVLRYAAACPPDPWSSRQLLDLALRSGRVDRAIGPLERLDRLELHDAMWARRLAGLHQAAGRYEAAAGAIKRALRREPYNAAFRELAATIELQRGQPDRALVQVQALTMLEPDRSIHWLRLAALYRRTGRSEQAQAATQTGRQLEAGTAGRPGTDRPAGRTGRGDNGPTGSGPVR